MNTAILTVVLTGALLAGQNATPTWRNDYRQAQQQAATAKKPLVVVFGSGANGWAKVIRAESPSVDVNKLLSDSYVCMYVDTTSPEGKKLAQNFEISGSVGIVISDRTGAMQAFWHQGDLSNQSMVHYLHKYAEPQLVVHGTETAGNTSRTSFYPTSESDAAGHSGWERNRLVLLPELQQRTLTAANAK